MKKIMFFEYPSFLVIILFGAMTSIFACKEIESPDTNKAVTNTILPKMVKYGSIDSAYLQTTLKYNSQGLLESVKKSNTSTNFIYTNGLLSSKKMYIGNVLSSEITYIYQNNQLSSYKEFFPNLSQNYYTLLEINAVDNNGFPKTIKITSVSPTTNTTTKTLNYTWKNGNVIYADIISVDCNQSATIEYDDKMTCWHEFQNPLKNPHFIDENFYSMGKYYSKNNAVKVNTPHCSNSETSYIYDSMGLPKSSKYAQINSNGFKWTQNSIFEFQ